MSIPSLLQNDLNLFKNPLQILCKSNCSTPNKPTCPTQWPSSNPTPPYDPKSYRKSSTKWKLQASSSKTSSRGNSSGKKYSTSSILIKPNPTSMTSSITGCQGNVSSYSSAMKPKTQSRSGKRWSGTWTQWRPRLPVATILESRCFVAQGSLRHLSHTQWVPRQRFTTCSQQGKRHL